MTTLQGKKLKNCSGKIFLSVLFVFIANFIILSSISAQGRRDWDKGTGPGYRYGDSLYTQEQDSIQAVLDSLRRLPVDSTARIKYFTYSPEYSPIGNIKDYEHPLLIGQSEKITYSVTFDSNNAIITRKFLEYDITIPLVVPLDEYIQELTNLNQARIFSDIFGEKYQGLVVDDLSQLFEKFTDIKIPLPFKSETIFGPPTVSLRINGSIDITASYQNIKSDLQVTSTTTSNQNNFNFKQEVYVTAKGTIGDKLNIDADWNTQRLFDFENQLKIRYDGYADEVIKRIEAGNVSLVTNSGIIQSTQALFGVKGDFQLGPLSLSAVLSQKKSKQEVKDFVGGAQEQNFNLKAYEYSDAHYFLDTIYKKSFLDVFNNTSGILDAQTMQNRVLTEETSFEVWVQTDVTTINKRYGVAHIQLIEQPTAGYDTSYKKAVAEDGKVFAGYFMKLDPSDYYINSYAGFISFIVNVPENFAVGVTYRTQSNSLYGTPSTTVDGNDTLVLKMIKSGVLNPATTPVAWELKLKNIYRLPVSKVLEEGFELQAVYYQDGNNQPNLPGQQKSLSNMLDIDRYTGTTREPPPDSRFDFLSGFTINKVTGDIIFPTLRPFWDNLVREGVDSSFYYKQIYTDVKLNAQNSSTAPNAIRYSLIGKAKGESGYSDVINLGLNVVQGSVKVMVGAQELIKDIDYSVDYLTGTVVIRNAAAKLSKDLKVSYETNDLFGLDKKTLIGLRGDYKIDEFNSLGFTFLNLEQTTLNTKVRIGEEPTNNSIFGVDFTTQINSKLLTRLVNMLPGYNTKEQSAFTLKGEFAYLTPDPNTLKSKIPTDNNESIAYVDDMEGSKKIVSLGTNYSTWTISSVPFDPELGNIPDSIYNKRGRMKWYNIPNDAKLTDIYPEKSVQAGQDVITPFYIQFDPTKRGIYNYSNNYNTSNGLFNKNVTTATNWNGIMKYLNTTSTDLLNENINFIEFNMRIDSVGLSTIQNGKLVIDLGRVSEDAILNGFPDSEDKNNNGILEISEDIGLDYKQNFEELAFYNTKYGTSLTLDDFENRDPGLDNNDSTGAINYDIIDGTQNNRFFEGGNKPDTEDLNKDGALNTSNVYFSYEIPLDTTNNQFISGRGRVGWFQYRIPLSEFRRMVGNPSLNNIEYARLYVKGVNGAIRVALVDFNLVGNQWYKPNKNDTTYNISIVSIEENPQIYDSPVPGDVLRQRIQNTTGGTTLSNEASLSIDVNNLVDGERKLAVKDYTSVPLDLFNYKRLKLFVNGDPSFNYTSEKIFDAWMIVRLGSDTSNYYEYRAPIHPDVRPSTPWNAQNEVTINFADLTAIKILLDSINTGTEFPVPNGPPGALYVVRGNPLINAIRQISVGIEKSRTGYNASVTGSVWFNEIRVLDIDDDNGFKYVLNAGVKLADLLTVNATLTNESPNFYSLDGRPGPYTRQTTQNFDISGTLNVHKFLNNAIASIFSDEWKDFLVLPLTFRHSEYMVKHKNYPNTDIDLEEARERRYEQILLQTGDAELAERLSNNIYIEAQTLDVTNEFGIQGMRLQFPSNNYIVQNIINKLSYNFRAVYNYKRDLTLERKDQVVYNGAVDFATDFGLSDNFNLNIGRIINLGDEYKDAKLYFALPFIPLAPLFSNNFTAKTDFNRDKDEKKFRTSLGDAPPTLVFRANRGFNLDWKLLENWIVDLTGTYSYGTGSDLRDLETLNDSLRTPITGNVLDRIFFNGGLINFGKDIDYLQTTTFNPKFNIPFIKKFVELTGNYNVTYAWSNPQTNDNIGYNVRTFNNINTSATIKLSEIANIFKSSDNPQRFRLRSGGITDTTDGKGKQSILDVFKVFGTFFPENITVNFTQSNTLTNNNVAGSPGFGNFWLYPTTKEDLGPSRMYQLGFTQYPGKRVDSLSGVRDYYNVLNDLSLTTSISPIFPEHIRMSLTFKKKWGRDNDKTYSTNAFGEMASLSNQAHSNANSNSIFFGGDVKDFKFIPSGTSSENLANVTEQFKSQLSSFPFPNWNITISGVEKFPLFGQFASAVTIENAFTSEFSERYTTDINNNPVPNLMAVTQGFTPLIGMNITFKEAFGGSLSAVFRYNTTVLNSLTPSSYQIQTTNTRDWSINANFTKAGFEIPMFGLSLQNDIAFSLTLSKTINDPISYTFQLAGRNEAPGNGSSVMTLNPSIQYSLSQRVQMQLFYKYIRTEPTQQTANIAPRTSNEGGLNIRISIQ
ncbi:MAG TPA: cell surface protein SprA [Ignavibacteria bacterium]|nr:cell surface protein SprA [Ignavibacteria bacterium]